MRDYLKHMRVPLIILGVMLAIYLLVFGLHKATASDYERGNNQCPTQRVYDYADKLTDREEEKLEELIVKYQEEIGCDIVLVVLDEPLRAYAESYADRIGYVSEDEYVMVYADNFYDENAFGYNKPYGDGCVFVDNWDRSDSVYGYAYNWLSTSGRVEDSFSSSAINAIIEDVNEVVNDDPYEAYKRYIEGVYHHMSGSLMGGKRIPVLGMIIAAAITAGVYLMLHLKDNKGRKTTVSTTYVNGGRPVLNRRQDILVNTHVNRRHIERSSSGGGGGGGGHHTSAGGHSHGGGGGHH